MICFYTAYKLGMAFILVKVIKNEEHVTKTLFCPQGLKIFAISLIKGNVFQPPYYLIRVKIRSEFLKNSILQSIPESRNIIFSP